MGNIKSSEKMRITVDVGYDPRHLVDTSKTLYILNQHRRNLLEDIKTTSGYLDSEYYKKIIKLLNTKQFKLLLQLDVKYIIFFNNNYEKILVITMLGHQKDKCISINIEAYNI